VHETDLAGYLAGRSQGPDEFDFCSSCSPAHPEMVGKIGKDIIEVLLRDAAGQQSPQDSQVLVFIAYRPCRKDRRIPLLQGPPASRNFSAPGDCGSPVVGWLVHDRLLKNTHQSLLKLTSQSF
jgi:hypothetical protein